MGPLDSEESDFFWHGFMGLDVGRGFCFVFVFCFLIVFVDFWL